MRRHLSLLLSGARTWRSGSRRSRACPGADAGYYGLLFSGTGPLLAVGIVLCSAAMLVAVRDRRWCPRPSRSPRRSSSRRVTTFAATEVPLYDWTYKHLAVVDYIMVHGHIAPDGTDIYAQWPAFFTAWAWFCEVTGVAPMTVAHLFAPAIHVLIALTVYTAARVHRPFPAHRADRGVRRRDRELGRAGLLFAAGMVGGAGLRHAGVAAGLTSQPRVRRPRDRRVRRDRAHPPADPVLGGRRGGLLCALRRARPWWAAVVMAVIAAGYLLLNLEAVLPYGLFPAAARSTTPRAMS